MCVHVSQTFDTFSWAEGLGLDHGPPFSSPLPDGDIWPGYPALVIRTRPGEPAPSWDRAHFGFRQDRRGVRKPIITRWLHNARSETIATLPTWRGPWWAGQRCIVPVSSWYEPRSGGGEWRFHRSQPASLLAAIWDRAAADGALCMSLVTTEPPAALQSYHDRMPMALTEPEAARWLDPTTEPNHLDELADPRRFTGIAVAPA